MPVTDDNSSPVVTYGKDAMNFAEWALAVPISQAIKRTRIRRTDKTRHPKTGEIVNRTLDIIPSAEFGYPTAHDVDVLIAAQQITLRDPQQKPLVSCSRYELIKMMGWRDEGWSYRRVTEAFDRWHATTLHFRRAWWDTNADDWVTLKFHPIDNIYEYENPGNPIAWEWNKHVHRDIVGNHMPFNLTFYYGLPRVSSKQAFAFLDKNFHRRRRRDYDLREFCTAHAGMGGNYTTSQFKRELNKVYDDLTDSETFQFLKPLSVADRYRKIGPAKYRVYFERLPRDTQRKQSKAAPIVGELTARGITPAKVAEQLVADYPAERIELYIQVFDFHAARNNKKGGGWLRKAIEVGYSLPDDFKTRAQVKRAAATKKRRDENQWRADSAVRQRDVQEITRLDAYWNSLNSREQEQLERDAFEHARQFSLNEYRKAELADDEKTMALQRQIIIRTRIESILAQ